VAVLGDGAEVNTSAEGEVCDEVTYSADIVESKLWLTSLASVGVMMSKVEGPVLGIAV
jgi:hypothetical protein